MTKAISTHPGAVALGAVATLWESGRDIDSWPHEDSLEPLHPRDSAVLRGESPDALVGSWSSPEARIAERILAAPDLDVDVVKTILDETIGDYDGEPDLLMEGIATLRAVGDQLESAKQWQQAIVVALCGLALQALAEQDEELVVSMERARLRAPDCSKLRPRPLLPSERRRSIPRHSSSTP